MEIIKEHKLFFQWQYEKIEQYLRKMSNDGYELLPNGMSAFGIFTFKFKKTEPKDVIYKIDYNPYLKSDKEFIDFVSECGWELCYKDLEMRIFRCEADKCISEDIYSNDADKLQVISKIKYEFTQVFVITCSAIALVTILSLVTADKISTSHLILSILAILFLTFTEIKMCLTYKSIKKRFKR